MFYPIGNTKATSVFHASPEDLFEVRIKRNYGVILDQNISMPKGVITTRIAKRLLLMFMKRPRPSVLCFRHSNALKLAYRPCSWAVGTSETFLRQQLRQHHHALCPTSQCTSTTQRGRSLLVQPCCWSW